MSGIRKMTELESLSESHISWVTSRLFSTGLWANVYCLHFLVISIFVGSFSRPGDLLSLFCGDGTAL